jgi:phosphoribosylamine-glycine ligase
MNKGIKKIIVLGGGNDQITLIEELRKRFNGVYIILIDYFDNPPAKKFADKHIIESTLDKEAVLQTARNEEAELVITACIDQAILTMAYVSEKLGLKCYLTYRQALDLTNKMYMKKVMLENGIPTSNYKIIESENDISSGNLKFPLVVKPVDNNSSKGISKVESKQFLKEAITEAFKNSRSKTVIAEEFVEGEEHSADAFLINGEPVVIILTKYRKVKENSGRFTILQSIFPVDFTESMLEKLKDIIRNIGKSFKIDNVPLFMQLIVFEGKINIIEFSSRTGGGSKQHFIKELVGVNIIENLIDITVGEKPRIVMKKCDKYASMSYVYAKPGIFHGLGNIEEMKKEGLVHDYYYYKSTGMEVLKSETSSDRVAGFFSIADSEADLMRKIREVDRRITVLNENSEDIMLHGLYYI